MPKDQTRESLRALTLEMGIKPAAARVGVHYATALRFLAGFPIHAPSRERIEAFFAANPGRATRTWAPETAPVGA